VKVLHVSDCYLPRLGGIETQVHQLATRQRAAGLDVEVLTATPKARHDPTSLEVMDGVAVHRKVVDLPFELPVHPRTRAQVAALLHRASAQGTPYDVAHVHTGVVSPFGYAALPALLDARVPVVVTVHSMWGPAAPAFGLADAVTHWARRPMVLSAVSSAAAAPVRRLVGAERAVRILPNGIEVADWLRDPLPRPDHDVLVVAVMRLAPRKRCLPLLRALAAVRRQVPPSVRLRALIVGDGPLRTAMRRHLDRSGLADWVELGGRWKPEAIRELHRRADLFVSAARRESFGIAALEARTAGVPVVAMAASGAGEFVVHGEHGLLVADDAALVSGVAELARDPALRTAMARRNRAEPPPTTWPLVLQECTDAYAEAEALTRDRV
jgi:glycosyltransferase involved in cell wall biosynthesis